MIKRAYSLEELFLYMESLEQLDMVWKVEKAADIAKDGMTVYLIEYYAPEGGNEPPDVIEFDD